ncbi:uncharacterized protein BDV14DRAFT_181526, partial [Aspergillus stella-maris]|uniref:uncharacterized protein n=1 Tax=Aspergillus stella-maris TaxID=1810926 RepID=UPI003CCD76CC
MRGRLCFRLSSIQTGPLFRSPPVSESVPAVLPIIGSLALVVSSPVSERGWFLIQRSKTTPSECNLLFVLQSRIRNQAQTSGRLERSSST